MIDRWVCVSCNTCGRAEEVQTDARLARRIARSYGWKVGLPGGVDLCPSCAPKETDQP